MKLFLLIMVPPLVGAFIGYITNAIAVKMLFRPLKEYRILGIRVPFTPGILPKQRHKLADSIGAMVERELLTPELMRQRFLQADTREKLMESISQFTGTILKRPPETFLGKISDTEADSLIASLKDSFFNSPAAATVTRTVVQRICIEAENHYPQAAARLIDFLRQADIRKNLEIQGQRLITEIMLGLNVFQRLLLSAGQYEKTIREQMPDIITKLIDQAENLLTSNNIRMKVLDFFNTFITKNISQAKIPGDVFSSIGDAILKEHGAQPLEKILSIGSESKQLLDNFLCSRLLSLANKEIEGLLKSVNVQAMVSQRINELDMIRVERIILDIMADQLKWINLFGGILGFLIGAFQVLFNLLLR